VLLRIVLAQPEFCYIAFFVDGLPVLADLSVFERDRVATDGALD